MYKSFRQSISLIVFLYLFLFVCGQQQEIIECNDRRIHVTISAEKELVELHEGKPVDEKDWQAILNFNGHQILFEGETDIVQISWETFEKKSSLSLMLTGSFEDGGGGKGTISRSVKLDKDGYTTVGVLLSTSTVTPKAIIHAEDWYSYMGGKPDFVHSQSVKKLDIDFVAHWQFKTPTVMYQKNNVFAALAVNVSVLTSNYLNRQPVNLDLWNPDNSEDALLAFGSASSVFTSHSIYGRDPSKSIVWGKDKDIELQYFVFSSARAPVLEGYREVTSFLWWEFGHDYLLAGAAEQTDVNNKSLTTFDSWRGNVWGDYLNEVFFEFECPGKIYCSSMKSNRVQWASHGLGTNNDAWFNHWFQTLRTAYGLYVYAERNNDEGLMKKASGVLNLALSAPQNSSSGGAFPSEFWLDKDGRTNHWFDDSGWAGLCNEIPKPRVPFPQCMEYYHSFDMSWTGTWLLKWAVELGIEKEKVMKACIDLGIFFIRQQLETGCVPSWYNRSDLDVAEEFSTVNAETAGVALFLTDLYHATKNSTYLTAAIKAMEYIEKYIVPERKWFDFETYFSCSPKPIDFRDNRTSQWPQNNLSKLQAAFAYLRLYEVTEEKKYLDRGKAHLDFLLLTQQVWPHPLLTPYLLGGFTTQNTDAEWSDARLAYGADLLLEYYKVTGELEYLERGVAAIRSGFAVAPYENWAHEGGGHGDVPGAVSSYHWGSGSIMASVELAHNLLQDGYIDVSKLHGVCVNGCTFRDMSFTNTTLSFSLTTPFKWDRKLVIMVMGATSDMSVVVNGVSIGKFSPSELSSGIKVPVS